MTHTPNKHFECAQTSTLEKMQKQQDQFYKSFTQRDEKLKHAFDQVNKSIEHLTHELDKRKLINNFNKEEKERLQQRVNAIGEKSEEADTNLLDRVTNLEKAVIAIGKNDENQDKSISKLEKLLYVSIGLIISFFITFGYKTIFLGM